MRFGMHISINKWLSFFFNLWKRYSSPVSCLTKLLQVTYPNIFHIYALPIFFILLISSLYSWCIACKFWYRILKFKLKTERRETRKQCERFPPHARDSYLLFKVHRSSLTGATGLLTGAIYAHASSENENINILVHVHL
jgi:hypothetical protein